MSTYEYRPNGPKTDPVYKIGIRDHVGRQKTADISTFALIVPTYGAWAGPSWGANHRSSTTSTINWDFDPCMNENIKKDGADPNKCYSMIDAMAKQHDWNYAIAEHGDSNYEASLKMTADEILLEDVKKYYFGGTYTCITGLGSIEADEIRTGDYELQTISYTSTSLDATEIQYAADLSIAFTFKLVGDALCVAKDDVVNTFKSIWGYVTDTLGNIITSTDGNQTITTQKTTDGDFLCICDGEKARLLDTDAYKEYNIGRIVLGGGSMATASNFVYEGDGKICLYGGTGDDIITTGENENATYYTFVGGDGFDTYYLTDGNRYEIADNGANEIYKKNENGGWDSVGDMYADATGTVWYSADHSCQLTHSSPWTLTFADGTTVVLGASFQSGDFGINLITLPTPPTEYN
ncbi:MAG TPA: hypothetical protein PKL22_11675, partial [Saprospiraceae bacterium]|nr:hypothetical protein [Saprospiraceae bacterium]